MAVPHGDGSGGRWTFVSHCQLHGTRMMCAEDEQWRYRERFWQVGGHEPFHPAETRGFMAGGGGGFVHGYPIQMPQDLHQMTACCDTCSAVHHHRSNPQLSAVHHVTAHTLPMPHARCRSIPRGLDSQAHRQDMLVHQDSAPALWYCEDPNCVLPQPLMAPAAAHHAPLHRCNSQPAGLCHSDLQQQGQQQQLQQDENLQRCDSSPAQSERITQTERRGRAPDILRRASPAAAAPAHPAPTSSASVSRRAHAFRHPEPAANWGFHSSTSSSESREVLGAGGRSSCFSPTCGSVHEHPVRRRDRTIARAHERVSQEPLEPDSVGASSVPCPYASSYPNGTFASDSGAFASAAPHSRLASPFSSIGEVYVRAQFSFDPSRDEELPCAQAGLPFKIGDILQVISKEDAHWWKAAKESNPSSVGLIPSSSLQKFRLSCSASNQSSKGTSSFFWRKKKQAKPKKTASPTQSSDLPTYEEVIRLRSFKRKTLVLLGAHGVGRRHIKKSLILSQPDKYAYPVPHTTREPKDDEVNGRQYFFVSHDEMMKGIKANEFLEYGQHEESMYGTRLDTIRQLHQQGKVAILDVEADALRVLRCVEFAPYVIFIASPKLLGVAELDENLESLVRESENIRANFGFAFDLTLVNNDIDRTIFALQERLRNLDVSPQWVPASWIY